MSIETKIRNLIKYMDDHDQPYEDIFEEIIKGSSENMVEKPLM